MTAGSSVDAAPDPQEMVGRYMRRRDTRPPYGYTPWACVNMVLPSAAGLCWLVSFFDGEVDVWRVDDVDARYQVRHQPAPSGRSS